MTHSISFLPQVDQIIVLQDGCISEVGSFKQLIQQSGAFADFLKNYLMDILVEDEEEKDQQLDADSTMASLPPSQLMLAGPVTRICCFVLLNQPAVVAIYQFLSS